MDVVFARTRHDYVPYTDFYNVAALSGFKVVYLDEVDWTVGQTVIALTPNSEWDAIPVNHRCRFIHWNFERLRRDVPYGDMASYAVHPAVDEGWASDPCVAREWGAKYVFFGGVRGLGSLDFRHKKYDVVSLMYWSAGRRQEFREMIKRFSRADADGGAWGEAREQMLKEARIMLTCHQDERLYSEPIRWTIAAHYGLPMVSEVCEDSGYWQAGKHYLSAPFDGLPALAEELLRSGTIAARLAANAWRLVVEEHPFRREVERAL